MGQAKVLLGFWITLVKKNDKHLSLIELILQRTAHHVQVRDKNGVESRKRGGERRENLPAGVGDG